MGLTPTALARSPGPQFLAAFAGVGLLAILWLWGSLSFGSVIMPGPHLVIPRIFQRLGEGHTWAMISLTLFRSFWGFSLALGVGIPLGLLLGQFPLAGKTFHLPLLFLQAAPPLLWVIPLILITQSDNSAPVWVAFLITLPLVTISMADARRALKSELFVPFRLYAPQLRYLLGDLILPQMRPAFQSIITLGFGLAFKSTLVGEWFGAQDGLGRWINTFFYSFEMVDFYALALLFVLLAALFAGLGQRLARSLLQEFHPSPLVAAQKTPEGFVQELAPHPPATAPLVFSKVDFMYNDRPLFHGLDLSISPGEVLLVTGDSGVGKTTLAKLALGLILPQRGTVHAPRHLAAMFQDDGLLAHRDSLGNAALAPLARRLDQPWLRAQQALEQVGLGTFFDHYPHELSGGMKKRLALARALASEPGLLILDEPFSSLHKEARNELWALFFRLVPTRGIPSLIITHYPDELKEYEVKHLALLPTKPY